MGSKKVMAVSVLIMVFGIGWLLNVFNLLPGMDWIWALLLSAVGVVILVFGGLNRLTFVLGPVLVVSGGLSMVRQAGHMPIKIEFPILVIVLGALMLLSQVLPLPTPQFLEAEPEQTDPSPNTDDTDDNG